MQGLFCQLCRIGKKAVGEADDVFLQRISDGFEIFGYIRDISGGQRGQSRRGVGGHDGTDAVISAGRQRLFCALDPVGEPVGGRTVFFFGNFIKAPAQIRYDGAVMGQRQMQAVPDRLALGHGEKAFVRFQQSGVPVQGIGRFSGGDQTGIDGKQGLVQGFGIPAARQRIGKTDERLVFGGIPCLACIEIVQGVPHGFGALGFDDGFIPDGEIRRQSQCGKGRAQGTVQKGMNGGDLGTGQVGQMPGHFPAAACFRRFGDLCADPPPQFRRRRTGIRHDQHFAQPCLLCLQQIQDPPGQCGGLSGTGRRRKQQISVRILNGFLLCGCEVHRSSPW